MKKNIFYQKPRNANRILEKISFGRPFTIYKTFILTTDVSNVAMGAVLSQGTLGSDRPVSFGRRTLIKQITRPLRKK